MKVAKWGTPKKYFIINIIKHFEINIENKEKRASRKYKQQKDQSSKQESNHNELQSASTVNDEEDDGESRDDQVR